MKLVARDTIAAAGFAAMVFAAASLAQDAQQRRGFSVAITEPVNQEVVFGKTKIAADVTCDYARRG